MQHIPEQLKQSRPFEFNSDICSTIFLLLSRASGRFACFDIFSKKALGDRSELVSKFFIINFNLIYCEISAQVERTVSRKKYYENFNHSVESFDT